MSDGELSRLEVLRDLDQRRLTATAAVQLLGLERRQVYRLLKAYRTEGPGGLISKRRGRSSNRRKPEAVRTKALSVVRERYWDFGPTLAAEKLREVHQITLGRETLRLWMIEAGIWADRKQRRKQVHQPRHRRECVGELVQVDGCEHWWFEDRGPQCTLLVFVDDATSRLMHLQFVESESTFAYFHAARAYLEAWGKPVAFYSDKHGVFRINHPGALGGDGMTQFGRALHALNIDGAQNALLTVGILLLWGLWVARAMPGFWLVLVIVIVPLANVAIRRTVEHLLEPPGSLRVGDGLPSVVEVSLERGLRALLIIGAAAVLAWGWGLDEHIFGKEDTLFTRLVHGALSAAIILLVADLLWQATKTAIDRKLAEAEDLGQPNTDEARRRARMRTLLPIFRNILFVVVIAVAVLMVLAAMGFEIGPLVAGLSVVGVAIGFGCQNFVRDIVAGMFYLLDDAFRVGEYIQSGNYKGTVEGFSIRSVKLRHQRGALYTVPFGVLGAVQNQSRDWTIDKLTVGITYDSDIERARKLIKQIGLELAEDPEFKPLILEPLKMQGVDALGDFAVQLRMKMMTLPGENFVIRRKALAMIKKAFDANGIKFAFPTVQIAGDGDPSAAAVAHRALELAHPAAAE
jgi:small-conductance mechanosensitive channel